jgi:hypothetical protein
MEPYTPPPKRPGGLTALAILNITFALIGMLAGLALTSIDRSSDENDRTARQMDYAADHMEVNNAMGGNPELSRAMAHGMAAQMRSSSPGAFRWMFAAGMTGGVLLLLSGFGFLGQRRVLGRHVGNAAGVALVVCGGIAITKLGFLYWGFPMLGAGYAIVVMLLVHFVYRPTLQR